MRPKVKQHSDSARLVRACDLPRAAEVGPCSEKGDQADGVRGAGEGTVEIGQRCDGSSVSRR